MLYILDKLYKFKTNVATLITGYQKQLSSNDGY